MVRRESSRRRPAPAITSGSSRSSSGSGNRGCRGAGCSSGEKARIVGMRRGLRGRLREPPPRLRTKAPRRLRLIRGFEGHVSPHDARERQGLGKGRRGAKKPAGGGRHSPSVGERENAAIGEGPLSSLGRGRNETKTLRRDLQVPGENASRNRTSTGVQIVSEPISDEPNTVV